MKRRLVVTGLIFLAVMTCVFSWIRVCPYVYFSILSGVPIESFFIFETIMGTIPPEERAEIYFLTITESYNPSHDPRRAPRFGKLYFVNNSAITPDIKASLEEKLSIYQVNIVWINNFHDAPMEKGGAGAVLDGAIVTLGSIGFPGRNRAYSGVGFYVNGLAISNCGYSLERMDSKWHIVGDPLFCIVS
jgi:hypothetical protein